ncbi:TMhelix containing protein [Vibrio phage vB_VviC_ZQ26]|nr:TMhelix containing protein [Vibrio phage vB_VviC_ZQ26]
MVDTVIDIYFGIALVLCFYFHITLSSVSRIMRERYSSNYALLSVSVGAILWPLFLPYFINRHIKPKKAN